MSVRLSRRAVIGAGAMTLGAAGAIAAGETSRGRRWLHTVGVVDGPDERPPDVDVDVVAHRFDSSRMGGKVEWAWSLPDIDPEAIVLCLHGRNQTHAYAFDAIGVHRFAADERRPWAVVAVDGGAASYWHRRADGTDPQAMIVDELLPTLRARLGDLPVVVLGWSMGGYGALLAAADYADMITAVAAGGPALWHTYAQSAGGAFDDADDFHVHDVFARVDALHRVPVRIDCGDDDPFASTVHDLVDELPDVEAVFGRGFHDAAFWRSRVRAQFRFFERALSYG